MFVFKYIFILLSVILFSVNSYAKETKYSCKPKSAAAMGSNGIIVYNITGKEKIVAITIKDGEGTNPGYFIFDKSKYEIIELGTGKAYGFNRNEPWTHIQDIFFCILSLVPLQFRLTKKCTWQYCPNSTLQWIL